MCRFLAYAGAPLLLADLLYRPTNSLIMQSYKARERAEPLNGDGFGAGWYVPEIDPTPCVQRSVTPAWSNRNLQSLAEKTRTTSLFAHVRAATPGMAVTEANVHPFSYDRFLWMHNGSVAGFHQIKRPLRDQLKDEFYGMIQGTTDSEHAFALFLNNLQVSFGDVSGTEMRGALVETIRQLLELTRAAQIVEPSFCNFAVTDGRSLVVSRFCSAEGIEGASLHYSRGHRFECLPGGLCDMHSVETSEQAAAVIVSSERLTDDRDDWLDVPDNSTITVSPDLSVRIDGIPLS
ncbi:MAG TPA: class II glutamine amidotransferase [Pyrinomonadaceae bacterium]|jgi:ergothioneine biosynthesis protein EgtC|nr:class II glutamine amidotransferase [Pyrinomonadaceae bacterium]